MSWRVFAVDVADSSDRSSKPHVRRLFPLRRRTLLPLENMLGKILEEKLITHRHANSFCWVNYKVSKGFRRVSNHMECQLSVVSYRP
ncbi:hypothetical protein RB195_015050 [Necator americanus]|uniref:Uncharacterized protein n=1 Tax=Necator americanus TaxID=51031 RepID=A0ABR1E5E8_NECAM